MSSVKEVYWSELYPLAPSKNEPDWYWFWPLGESYPTIIEVWKDRDISRLNGLWGEKIKLPKDLSPRDTYCRNKKTKK